EPARAEMRRGEEVPHGRDGSEGDAAALRGLVELVDGSVAAPLLEERLEGVEVGAPGEAVGEDLEPTPFGVAHEVHEALPLVLLDRTEKEPPVATLDEAERLDWLPAEARGDEAGVGPELEGQLEDRRHRLLRRHLDVLAPAARQASKERTQRPDGRVEGRLETGLVTERLERRQVGQ